MTAFAGAVIVHRDVDPQKGRDKKHGKREVFGIWLQEHISGREGVLSMQRLRALVVFNPRARGGAVRVQEGISTSLAGGGLAGVSIYLTARWAVPVLTRAHDGGAARVSDLVQKQQCQNEGPPFVFGSMTNLRWALL